MPSFAPSINEIVAQTAEGKGGGGQGPGPGGYGQAGGGRAAAAPDTGEAAQEAEAGEPNDFGADLGNMPRYGDLDPIGQYREQQLNLATASHFAGLGRSGMGPNTSQVLAMHGNKLRANAENWERYIQEARLAAELERLGLGGGPSGTKKAIEEHDAAKKAGTGVTPSGYNPNNPNSVGPANQPIGQPSNTPPAYGAARF